MAAVFDVKAIRESLSLENKFAIAVSKLIPVRNAPVSDDSEYLLEDNKSLNGSALGPEKRGTSLEELQKKLQEFKGKRLQYKGTLVKKGMKNKIDKIRKREARKANKNLLKANRKSANLMSNVKPAESTERKKKLPEATAPVFNKEGHIVFNKFDFADDLYGKRKKNRDKVEKDPRKMLQKLKEQKERIDSLEKAGKTEKVTILKDKIAWKTALLRAQGTKVTDDPKLLIKTLKRKESAKKKSREQWKKREEEVAKKMQRRQDIRRANIQERTKARKAKKIRSLVKKGRLIRGVHV